MAWHPTKQQKVAAVYCLAGFLIVAALDGLVRLLLPKPAILAPHPALSKTMSKQDVSLQQWSQAAERLEEKRKLSRL
ncbi:hypothetical protein [Rheinheimera sp.]|uniref:hypothetical protein n=1 Tax=Rheinheimera sp. TaxID=1869214 RepID=UPI003D2D3351